ncbi:MAG: hypothetical protein A3G18_11300 [Rhodospirillales bacterium RIFCSPLOWO2_12_FULL_58_28]|nr:MAG: hypothetical protein A3H92_10445 [Rhodospirillales bacterium RIFCSPLOWO2_02_FULL_58_16]OHC77776.1 MAG: hypothetical protein A3G18_11300 [Rhodospirillales bacterium RIFCSPLOWO2_12_FULL_58_28]
MTKPEHDYRDGDVIYLENDSGGQAYEVVKGKVEISRAGDKGKSILAVVRPGEAFGGRNSTANGLRASTARAVGRTLIKAISEPASAAAAVFEVPAQAVEKNVLPKKGFFRWLLGKEDGGAHPGRIEIMVAALAGEVREVAGDQTDHLVAALGNRKRVRVRRLNKVPAMDLGDRTSPTAAIPREKLLSAAVIARQWLAQSGADLLIWGEVPEPGMTLYLRFIPAETEGEDKPGLFGLAATLILPANFGPELAEILLAVSLAAVVTQNEKKLVGLNEQRAESLAAIMPIIKHLPPGLTTRERSAVKMCFGNVLAGEAARRNSLDLYQMAAQTYRAALEGISHNASPFDWAIAHKHLGSVLQALGERTNDKETLNAAAAAFGEALKVLTKGDNPGEWATTQNRLGLTFYKLDLIAGDTERIKLALTAFQSALQVFTRSETPQLWAEALNNFAQAAQVLGEQLRNPEVLEKAANACRSALEVRKKEKQPLLWAATQNNLGSALFLLGKLKKDLIPLRESAEAFGKAYDFYKAYGAEKMAATAKKNLSHVERLLEKHSPNERPDESEKMD